MRHEITLTAIEATDIIVSFCQNGKTDVNVTSEVFIAQQICSKGNKFRDFLILQIV